MATTSPSMPSAPSPPTRPPVRRHRHLGRRLTAAGLLLVVAVVVVAFTFMGRFGQDVQTVPFGETLTYTATWSGTADVFATIAVPTPLSDMARCVVTTEDGTVVPQVPAEPYQTVQDQNLVTSAAWDANAGTTYLVTCREATTTIDGHFGVALWPRALELGLNGSMILGFALVLAGAVVGTVNLVRRDRAPHGAPA